ncbi:DUF3558 family protein [Actinokineospora sp.]|uniref:DUF3558 family protein n=1 Tax=Actinokineospora sp. TaxID=1872133 RepID=UPI0040378CE0
MTRPHLGVLLTVLTITAACTPAPPTEPAPRPTTRPTRPPITRPLNASAFLPEDVICSILPRVTAEQFGLDNGSDFSFVPESPECSYQPAGSKPSALITPLTIHFRSTRDVLAEAYEKPTPEQGPPPNFVQALTIAGQPAAKINPDKGERRLDKSCEVHVGLSDTSGIVIEALSDGNQACNIAIAVADGIIRSLAN